MKTKQLLGATLALLLWVGSASADTNYTYNFTVNQPVPDANINGLTLSTNLTGMVGDISNLTVGLSLTGGFNGDLYSYLVGPNGGFAILLNRVGVTNGNPFGYSDAGLNITFDDSAANNVHYYQAVIGSGFLTGAWAPDGEAVSPLSLAVGSTLPTAMLTSFYGTNPNGTWTLFLADLSAGNTATVLNWSLNITNVPEPTSLTLGLVSLAALLGQRRWAKR